MDDEDTKILYRVSFPEMRDGFTFEQLENSLNEIISNKKHKIFLSQDSILVEVEK